MHVSEILDRLVLLGLDEQEAHAYLHLSRAGPAKAADVALALKLGRTETYRTLTSLVQRNFAHITLGRPALYVARSLDDIVSDVRVAEQARLDNVLRIQREIVDAMSRLESTADAAATRNPFRLVQGRREAYRTLERMLMAAQRSIDAVATHAASIPLGEASGLLDLATRRAAEGVRVRGVLHVADGMRGRLQQATDAGARFRHDAAERSMRFVIVDGRELLLWLVSDPSARLVAEADVAVWSSAPDFVATQWWLFERAWAAATPVEPTGVHLPVLTDAPAMPRTIE